MAKKKSTRTSSLRGAEVTKETTDDEEKGVKKIAKLFTTLHEKVLAWYRREREGIALIEGFQSAVLALRDAQAVAEIVDNEGNSPDKKGAETLSGLAGNVVMNPWLAEDLYEQMQTLPTVFEELLEEMCTLHVQAREIVQNEEDDGDQEVKATQLRPVDYLQMISHELATFEAEYQHIEALLRLISFETSTDELRTLVISWSTSPFLDPDQTRRFYQRHLISSQQRT